VDVGNGRVNFIRNGGSRFLGIKDIGYLFIDGCMKNILGKFQRKG
jgi:hypothetical protein